MADSNDSSRTACLSGQHPATNTPECERTTDGQDLSALLSGPAINVPQCERTTDGQDLSASSATGTLPTAAGSAAVIGSLAGKTFGDYELLEEIARGGMGVVFKARQKSLDRKVALKMILEGQLASEQSVQRFYQEARAAAALDHPNIVPIYEIGQCEGRHFFTMAFVEGVTLSALVRKGGVPEPAVAASMILGVAEAVAFAHAHHVIHRDLKPDNVLVDRGNRPRVTDFGLAKCLGGDSGLTSAGQILGTPSYMAPEQAWGKVDQMGPATDVYAVGGILYFLLTGRPPFEGESTMQVLAQVTNKAPEPPSKHAPNVPPELEAICLKCLEKEPANRYASADDLAAALRACGVASLPSTGSVGSVPSLPSVAGGVPSSSCLIPTALSVPPGLMPPPPASPAAGRRRRALAAVAVLALAGCLGAGWFVLKDRWGGGVDDVEDPAVLVKPTRHDFGVKIEMVDVQPGQNGEHRITEGTAQKFRIEVERDAFVGIWNIGPDGSVMQIFPNDEEPENFIQAGRPRLVPGNDKYEISSALTGKPERIWVMAASKRWDPVEAEKFGPHTLFKTPEQQNQLTSSLRAFVLKKRKKSDGPQVTEEVLRYKVMPKP